MPTRAGCAHRAQTACWHLLQLVEPGTRGLEAGGTDRIYSNTGKSSKIGTG